MSGEETIPAAKNKGGRPPSVWQSYPDRCEILNAKYTPKELIAIADDLDKLAEQSSIDKICIPALANQYRGLGKKKSQEQRQFSADEHQRLLDRTLGKPKSIVLHGGAPDEPPIAFTEIPTTPEQAAEFYKGIARAAVTDDEDDEPVNDGANSPPVKATGKNKPVAG